MNVIILFFQTATQKSSGQNIFFCVYKKTKQSHAWTVGNSDVQSRVLPIIFCNFTLLIQCGLCGLNSEELYCSSTVSMKDPDMAQNEFTVLMKSLKLVRGLFKTKQTLTAYICLISC